MSNGPEFSWEYSHGGSQGNNYSPMGMNGSTPGGGRQWLHSNQANSGFMQSSGQNSYSSPSDPFAAYNQSVTNQYANFKASYGHSQMGPAAVNTMFDDSNQGMGNGMNQSMGMDQSMNQYMGQGMGQGIRNGLGNMGGGQRLTGGYSGRSNGK
ncbi:hypothetical protein KR032_000979 [Drosophila birchii]|nr:hypothetical protein KR032_000979 [Drosophila birchii]